MRVENNRTKRAWARVAAVLGLATLVVLLGSTTALGAPDARDAAFDPEKYCFQAWPHTKGPQVCNIVYNKTSANLNLAGSSLNHGSKWINAAGDTQDAAVIIDNYDTSPSDGTYISPRSQAAYMAVSTDLLAVHGSMELKNSIVDTNTTFKVPLFGSKEFGCDLIAPRPANGWTCATSVNTSGRGLLVLNQDIYCCVFEHLTAETTPTVTAAATRTQAPVVTLPVECKASRRGLCRGMLTFRAGTATGAARFVVPRGTRRQVLIRLRKPLRHRSAREYRLRLHTIQPNGRAVLSHQQRGRPRDLLAPAG
jgi:hypothetical protein